MSLHLFEYVKLNYALKRCTEIRIKVHSSFKGSEKRGLSVDNSIKVFLGMD